MKKANSIYETPRVAYIEISPEGAFAASTVYGNAGSDGKFIFDEEDY